MTATEDKRSDSRIACKNTIPVQISLFDSDRFTEAHVVDHCMNGISFISDRAFFPGSAIIFKVAYSAMNGSCSSDLDFLPSVRIGEVKWCRKLPGETSTAFNMGVKYFPDIY
jgi:hypothetical protein